MKSVLRLSNDEIGDIFSAWNTEDLNSYLIEITAAILHVRNPENSQEYLIDTILDCAEQKGTGKWTAVEGLEENVPVTLISEAVFAR